MENVNLGSSIYLLKLRPGTLLSMTEAAERKCFS